MSERLQRLWPTPELVDEGRIARLDALRIQAQKVEALRRERAARLASPGAGAAGSSETSRLEAQRGLLAQVAGTELSLADEELVALRRLGEGRALQQDWIWTMGDPDGDGIVDPEGLDGFLQYLSDVGSSEQSRLLNEHGVGGDGVPSASERAAAMDALRRRLRDFERLDGVDVDLDGRVDANEAELFLRHFQRADWRADLDGDGSIGPGDLARFERAMAGQ